jgi:transposase
MATVQNQSLPVALSVHSATPHEVTQVEEMLAERTTTRRPKRMIGDKAFDSDGLDKRLAEQGIRLIAPNRSNRRKSQDGRELRRYCRRWKVERFWAWLQSFRRLCVRYEYLVENYLSLCHLACALLLMRAILR